METVIIMKSSHKRDPVFSIIIAVYNGEKTLLKTLECLRFQQYQDFEIILVNDGSKDGSGDVIQNFIRKYPDISVQYFSQENKGLGGARNTGLRNASGRFMVILDQDDIWYPEKLETLLMTFEQYPEASFVTHHLYRHVGGKIQDELCCGFIKCGFMEKNIFDKLLYKGNRLCCASMSFRRNVLDTVGYFSEDRKQIFLSEDYDYWLRATRLGLKFYLLKEILGEYIVHENNCSHDKLLMLRNEWNVVRRHYSNRPLRKWWDPLKLMKRRGKILLNQILALF